MAEERIDCRDCAFCSCDPDGLFCVHKTSLQGGAGWGWGLAKARSEHYPCGPDAKKFEMATAEQLKARGRATPVPEDNQT